MPPATLAAVAPYFLGATAIGGMVDNNVQNKAAIKNAENAQKSAQAGVMQNQQAAQQNLAGYQQAHPMQQQTPGPAYSGQSVPLAGTPPPGALSGGMDPRLAMLALLQQGGGHG